MSVPRHHPSAAVLADYASGALRPAFAAVTAAHLEVCALCRAEVHALETLGGAMIEDLAPEALSAGRLEQAMAALDQPAPAAQAPAPTVDRIAFGRARWLGPGMTIRKAKPGPGSDLLYLLQLPAGLRTIPHGHWGVEFTTVLSGAYDDGIDHFAAGDFCELNDELEHQPMVAPDGPCLCLIASEKPMRQFTRLGRLVHWMTGV